MIGGPPMRLLALILIQIWPSASLFAHGFMRAAAALLTKSSTLDDAYNSPTIPDYIIDTDALLSQAYFTLTIEQLRDLLRQCGGKLSGNKRDLVDRLGEQMNTNNPRCSSTLQIDAQSAEFADDERQKLLNFYNNLTLKQLKEILRKHGAKLSGNKRELVHRLMILQYESHDDNQTQSSQPKTQIDPQTEGWSILEPSTNSDDSTTEALVNGAELPLLSGLLFVNKPPGWSTLPTKQQLDNPACPGYPCLSDSVKKWLYGHADGKNRLKQALKDEERWWDYILQMSQDAKQRKKWKKMKQKQEAKMRTFEPRPAHRLDIDTSGVVCIALTPYALRAANMLFEKKSQLSSSGSDQMQNLDGEKEGIQKRYVALVEGTLGSDEYSVTGVVEHSIGQVWMDDHNEWATDVSGNGRDALIRPGVVSNFVSESLRDAKTSYRAVNWTSTKTANDVMNATRVELTPHTGRGHQLRLHMISIGHPIVGDDMHGALKEKKSAISRSINRGRLCLHASKLSMDVWDGTTDEFRICRVDIESSPPF